MKEEAIEYISDYILENEFSDLLELIIEEDRLIVKLHDVFVDNIKEKKEDWRSFFISEHNELGFISKLTTEFEALTYPNVYYSFKQEITNLIRSGEYKNLDIESDFNIPRSMDTSDLTFNNCTFNNKLLFGTFSIERNIGFYDCTFLEEIDLTRNIFNKNFRIQNSKIYHKLNLTQTKFNGLCDFYKTEFHYPQYFHLTDFLDRAIFSNCTFKKMVKFLHNKVGSNSYISFESSTFEDILDISRSNFHCNLQFWGSSFKKNTIVKICNLIKQSSIDKKERHKTASELKETFRIIKNSFAKNGNNTSEIYFKSLELKTHILELNLFKSPSKFFSLILNLISNNFGTNWFYALVFITVITSLSYGILLKNFDFVFSVNNLKLNIYDCLKIINVTKWEFDNTLFNRSKKSVFIIIFVARIFIAYGIYQFIQAFRVYSKK